MVSPDLPVAPISQNATLFFMKFGARVTSGPHGDVKGEGGLFKEIQKARDVVVKTVVNLPHTV